MQEVRQRGPVSCGVDAEPLLNYTGGIITATSSITNHVVSIVGWGSDDILGKYWIVRNSWGSYWGEMGFFKSQFGALNLEDHCVFAVPGTFTTENFPCFEDGSNCVDLQEDGTNSSDVNASEEDIVVVQR